MVTCAIKVCAAFVLALLAAPAASMATFGQVSGTNGGKEPFVAARAIAVAPDGSVYVLDARKGDVQRVRRLTRELDPILTFGRPGSGPGELAAASDIAVDAGGDVYVTDVGNDRIQKFTADGVLIDERWSGTSATHIAAGEGAIYTAGPPLRGLNPRGAILFSREGRGGALAAGPSGGEIFQDVVDGIARIGPDGRLVNRIGDVVDRGAVGPGGLRAVGAFTVSAAGRVFVVDGILGTLQQFEFDGRFVSACTERSLRRVLVASDLAADPSGDVYVAEGTRVTRFADVRAPAVPCDETGPAITLARLVRADAGGSRRQTYRLQFAVAERARIDLTATASRRGRSCAGERVTPRRLAAAGPRFVAALLTVTVPRGCRLESVRLRARDPVGNVASVRVRPPR
ncbi:MAG: hypothetical protein AVDCRST_MAG85-3404 [uncultured Solirubrobacteraceae bacterium]|uniref:NHL repeat domain protein n=1 Tax=uncultured Solirubrobacteraceae bacterium TaxID=1162706 RepID=A0A6J4TPW6_9ACTN|nr:MAG: hypothetical protein AVDCRST_MAG85-3404 [uncultured Solirubrobacteraceae bacterium]